MSQVLLPLNLIQLFLEDWELESLIQLLPYISLVLVLLTPVLLMRGIEFELVIIIGMILTAQFMQRKLVLSGG